MGIPLNKFQTKDGLVTGWWNTGPVKKTPYMANRNKKQKILSKSDSNNEITEFPSFIVIKSQKETHLYKLFPFLIEKIISCRVKPWNVKKKWKQ